MFKEGQSSAVKVLEVLPSGFVDYPGHSIFGISSRDVDHPFLGKVPGLVRGIYRIGDL